MFTQLIILRVECLEYLHYQIKQYSWIIIKYNEKQYLQAFLVTLMKIKNNNAIIYETVIGTVYWSALFFSEIIMSKHCWYKFNICHIYRTY